MEMRKLLLAHPDLQLKTLLEKSILIPAGFEVTHVADLASALALMPHYSPDLVMLGEKLQDDDGLDLASELTRKHPNIPILFIVSQASPELLVEAIRCGVSDCLFLPLRTQEIQAALTRAINRQKSLEDWSHLIAQDYLHPFRLPDDLPGTGVNTRPGLNVPKEVEKLLEGLVRTSVEMSTAEEGYLLLIDEDRGELFIHTSYLVPEDLADTFHISISDGPAGQVLRSGESINLFDMSMLEIQPGYQVHALIYAPLRVNQRVIGVFGVHRRQTERPFREADSLLINTLAQITALLIENANQCTENDIERHKLETILTGIEDGLIVTGADGRIILANNAAHNIFGLSSTYLKGKEAKEVFRHPDLQDIFENIPESSSRTEINLEDGRIFNAHIAPIAEIGIAITIQDISHLKELDRIKTDFVNTVSHDLRSPLTTILGYAELMDRVGPLNDQQKDFVQRIQFSTSNITALINDLLDLGQIEAGFDVRKEILEVPSVIQQALEDVQKRYMEKNQTIELGFPENLPHILGNPYRLRQLFKNLVGNAIQFTQAGGRITIQARAEASQVIIQFIDNGSGIPNRDQPYIFNKFYRGSNIPADTPGTGLGLAIVKSIVENHQGRIWVDSKVGQGTTFTVVLPTV